jgi:hypothetical protein
MRLMRPPQIWPQRRRGSGLLVIRSPGGFSSVGVCRQVASFGPCRFSKTALGVLAAIALVEPAIGQMVAQPPQRPARVFAHIVGQAASWRSSDRADERQELALRRIERPCDPSANGAIDHNCRLIVTEIE